jgi:hypothetical protein
MLVPAALLFALTAPAALGDNAVGMNVHDGRAAFIEACDQAGVTWVRMDANWFALEPSPDDYRWAALDAAVRDARGRGLQVFLTLAYTPSWVPRHGDTDGRSENDVPNGSAEWVDFVSDAVTHYRALGVTHFGLWNEPNLQGFFEGSVDEYAGVLVLPGAAAVRAACADCKVLGPELAHVGEVDDWLEAALARTTGAWDIITHHSYNGFPETGWHIWEGDGFLNAIESRRFAFTRRALREVLDAAGWTGEVWITETGYRATPPGDAGEEGLQAIYVRRVLEEQLQRAWWTNSFFYEISDCGPDQPTCTIDGFGLIRATSGAPGSRTFPGDFRVKPAFGALQAFIQANPAIVGASPPPQCGDGVDNDGDGRVDLADRGCSGPTDDDESDDPPRATITAARRAAVSVDGDLGEWAGATFTALPEWRGTEPLGPGDLQAELAAAWSPAGLWLAVRVRDDVHDNPHPAPDAWQGDGVQVAFDVGQSGGVGYDGVDDHELSFARGDPGGAPRAHRHAGPGGASDDFEVRTSRVGDLTLYEIRIAASALPSASLREGVALGFSALVNDADGAGRVGWLEWTSGIGVEKRPEDFGALALGPAATPPGDAGVSEDAGAPEDAGPRPDAGAPGDAGVDLDAGASPRDGGAPPRDAGGLQDAGPAPAPAEGCHAAGPTSGAPLLGLLLGLGMHARRRKKR